MGNRESGTARVFDLWSPLVWRANKGVRPLCCRMAVNYATPLSATSPTSIETIYQHRQFKLS